MADQAQGVPAPPPLHPSRSSGTTSPTGSTGTTSSTSSTKTSIVHLIWSKSEPEFSGKPDEDAEAHLLHTNDWMNAHHFVEVVRVQRFCLTLLGEARLWYHSLETINVNLQGLQNLFRQQYSKIGNTREQLFHTW